jgi:hypothetical protein
MTYFTREEAMALANERLEEIRMSETPDETERNQAFQDFLRIFPVLYNAAWIRSLISKRSQFGISVDLSAEIQSRMPEILEELKSILCANGHSLELVVVKPVFLLPLYDHYFIVRNV